MNQAPYHPEPLVFIPADISSARGGAFQADSQLYSLAGKTMGTYWAAKLAAAQPLDLSSIEEAIIQELDTVIAQMSPWDPDSDLRRFQRTPAHAWLALRPQSYRVLERALSIAQETNGAYDPTFAHAIDLLGFGPSSHTGYNYASAEVREAFERAGFQQARLDPATHSLYQPGGLYIDLCSIAKGFAIDLVCEKLQSLGLGNLLFEIGGEARGLGCKPDGRPWLYAIEPPPHASHSFPRAHVALCSLAVATSGNYLRFAENNGEVIGHLVAPKHAQEDDQLLSVSVFSDNCMDADAYATALFLMGTQQGLAFAKERFLAAFFQTQSSYHLSPSAKLLLD